MKVKRAILEKLASSYKNSSKKGKGELRKELIATTDYNRSYASWLLSNSRLEVVLLNSEGKRVIFIGEIWKIRLKALVWLWQLLDYSWGKRWVAKLEA